MKILISIFTAFVLFFLHADSASAEEPAAPWPTTEFEIRWYSPSSPTAIFKSSSIPRGLSEEERDNMISWNNFLERSLEVIANSMKSAGLAQPMLPIVTDSSDKKKFVVYAYDFKDEWILTNAEKKTLGYYRGYCFADKKNTVLPKSFDLDPFLLAFHVANLRTKRVIDATQGVLDEIYTTMAHELFHAVQYTYDEKHESIRFCERVPGNGMKAVTEGTASAVGAILTEKRYPGYFKRLSWKQPDLGVYKYGGMVEFLKAWPQANDQDSAERATDRKTSSFWRYLAERFGGLNVFHKLFTRELGAATLKERYKWLNDGVSGITKTELYILFPEFQSEFSSYVPDRYPGILGTPGTHEEWNNFVYPTASMGSHCHPVKLTAADFYDHVVIDAGKTLYENSATCVDLEWSDISPPFQIEVQATNPSLDIVDQLHIGVSFLNTNGQSDSCYKKIMEKAAGDPSQRKTLECVLGKAFLDKDPDFGHVRSWKVGSPGPDGATGAFFERPPGSSGRATIVVTNMALVPGETKRIPVSNTGGDEVFLSFAITKTEMADGSKYKPVKQTQLRDSQGILASANPDRYSYYGIRKQDTGALPNGLGTSFQTESVSNPNKKYSILPLSTDFKFGVIGDLTAIVSNGTAATSVLCNLNEGMKPVGKITQSDKELLRFKVATDICRMKPDGKIEKVDRLDAEFVYAFGRRAYPATAPQNVITPGLELYIDEYLKELARAGVPIPPTVLMSDGSVPGDEDGDGTPDDMPDGPEVDENKKTKTKTIEICPCTCEEYKKLLKLAEEAKRDPAKIRKMRAAMKCIQICAQAYGKCKK